MLPHFLFFLNSVLLRFINSTLLTEWTMQSLIVDQTLLVLVNDKREKFTKVPSCDLFFARTFDILKPNCSIDLLMQRLIGAAFTKKMRANWSAMTFRRNRNFPEFLIASPKFSRSLSENFFFFCSDFDFLIFAETETETENRTLTIFSAL